MIRLILVRHGQTAWNAQARYQGQADVPLDNVGQGQAKALGRRFTDEAIDVVYASDLQRARMTAQSIGASHDLPVLADPRLREMDFGAWDGLTYEQIQARDAEALAAWQSDPLRISPPGGETLAQVAARAGSVLDDVVRIHQKQTVLLVSHGGLLRLLLSLAMGLDPQALWRFRLDIASISELHLYPGDAVLVGLNDRHHLVPQNREEIAWVS